MKKVSVCISANKTKEKKKKTKKKDDSIHVEKVNLYVCELYLSSNSNTNLGSTTIECTAIDY